MKILNTETAPLPAISLNQITKFINSTPRGKLKIVKDQKHPPKIPSSYYATPAAAMRRFIKSGFDNQVILDIIEILKSKYIDPDNKNAIAKNSNHIFALRRFLDITFREIFNPYKCSFSSPKIRRCQLGYIELIVSPDIIIRREQDGKKFIGAMKFDFHKDPVNYTEGRLRAVLIKYYLENIKEDYEIVDPNLCLCVDVINTNIYRPIGETDDEILSLGGVCDEISRLWNAA